VAEFHLQPLHNPACTPLIVRSALDRCAMAGRLLDAVGPPLEASHRALRVDLRADVYRGRHALPYRSGRAVDRSSSRRPIFMLAASLVFLKSSQGTVARRQFGRNQLTGYWTNLGACLSGRPPSRPLWEAYDFGPQTNRKRDPFLKFNLVVKTDRVLRIMCTNRARVAALSSISQHQLL
jgi:hypothetical protein